MKFITQFFLCLMVLFIFFACNNNNKTTAVIDATDTLQNQRFFPVTSYIKGQLFTIRDKGINPIKYTTINNKKDSVWLKTDSLEKEVAEFLDPVIDSTNLNTYFLERSFNDKTINAITLTYEPVKQLPDSINLSGWNIYIDPQSGDVKQIYMNKKNGNKTVQLIWKNNENCKAVYLSTDEKGNFSIEKEVLISWDY